MTHSIAIPAAIQSRTLPLLSQAHFAAFAPNCPTILKNVATISPPLNNKNVKIRINHTNLLQLTYNFMLSLN